MYLEQILIFCSSLVKGRETPYGKLCHEHVSSIVWFSKVCANFLCYLERCFRFHADEVYWNGHPGIWYEFFHQSGKTSEQFFESRPVTHNFLRARNTDIAGLSILQQSTMINNIIRAIITIRNTITTVTLTSIKKWLLSTILFLKTLGGSECWDLFSNQQMGVEVQKNLGMLMWSEVEGGNWPCFYKTAFILVFYIGHTEKCQFLALCWHFEAFNIVFMKFLSLVKLFIRIWYTFWKKKIHTMSRFWRITSFVNIILPFFSNFLTKSPF